MNDHPKDLLSPAEQQLFERFDAAMNDPVLDAFVEEFAHETDRAAVVLGAAQLDELLRQLLEKALLPLHKKGDEHPLLGRDRPLSSFSSRTALARGLGLINQDFAKSLDLIRKIRNSFAHQVDAPPLNCSPHREWIENLSRPISSPTFWDVLNRRFGTRSPSTEFRSVVSTMAYLLKGSLANVQRVTPQLYLATNMFTSMQR